ncbi:TcpE family conjugal transfer membrane protein [Listeria newyorkensis]|uniref:TcpE family conjugal transfer membrane protein n=1 Tax=Listeria newyorkensis TaxID=1497681 RepID=UPI0010F4913E|nr:TcpE family conjugal transfer membrane protein [Listeria newyorkensis]
MQGGTSPPKIKMYVISNMMRFERKIYALFGYRIGRAINIRSLFYFIGFMIGMVLWRHFPVLNLLVGWLPFLMAYIGVPVGMTYLMSGVTTENRNPAQYFVSVLRYYARKQKHQSFYRGKLVPKPRQYRMQQGYFYRVTPDTPIVRYRISGGMTARH